ncbi:peptide chain release factor N(5)-glutamine methyltransferase [Bartonella krasnovii]|uniref:Release factor glutamine methyltransferase n=1 Tax=Bartonella krasnovii TaxID=2267275 RepID=A0ABY3W0Q7_9HYPH|nr:peptide chain release factor N(5)-glutamine methyltransferase [Bartonella krasnovii]UNF29285.1 peptide chain release factor N(5)-glutamine methyltransferase [Bartonella krasnovii]UNF35642.1 peptide chain release factor N(5)-glutamine methyltransferase [Bartonella krasnovii]UNF38956.1 peptide chain release factor N(5)-glutamine methyltransferase [Bartonella krasnovii]UNF40687.1 peptide chain release factor N(5)-glutamine methyltransferase [Bartonella krasnovii]UNF42346.1 peptide chain releas
MNAHTLNNVIRQTQEKLHAQGISEASLEAKILIEWITNTNASDRILQPNLCLSFEQIAQLENAIQRRIAGEPVYRIIGAREFYGISFTLSKETLEPRPDTETLVDLVLPLLKKQSEKSEKITLLDMGTGSGAIAIAILKQVPQSYAVAVDISDCALKAAKKNAENADVINRFTPLLSDWFDSVTGQFDLIISNPPYIPEKDIQNLAKEVRLYDPLRALIGGKDGLNFYRKLSDKAANYLKAEGYVAVEIGYSQEKEVCDLFEKNGFKRLEIRKDLNGIPRALLFVYNP